MSIDSVDGRGSGRFTIGHHGFSNTKAMYFEYFST